MYKSRYVFDTKIYYVFVQDVQHIWYMMDIGHVRTSGLYKGINSSANHRMDSDHGSAGKIAL
jgi:hypothetical protein